MKKILFLICLLSQTLLFCQNATAEKTPKIIEVTGVAEMSIPPNMLVFSINLTERMEGKEKLTIDKQERSLKEGLLGIGIDIQKDLKIIDLNSSFLVRKRKKDMSISDKDYRLTVTDMSKIGKIQDLADKLHFNKLDLVLSTNTDLPKYRKETKISAIKAAKDKAEYLLAAIGQKLGKAVFVQETEFRDSQFFEQFGSNAFHYKELSDMPLEENELGIKNLHIKFSICVKFEIE
jgi:uncharacterized protein